MNMNDKNHVEINALVDKWRKFFSLAGPWHELVKDIQPHAGGCGLLYELPNYLNNPLESFAIADMRNITHAEPHYHRTETEVYFFLEGSGLVVVGDQEINASLGDVIITPPLTAHYVIPDSNCIIAVVNTPPFNADDCVLLTKTDHTVNYNHEIFLRKFVVPTINQNLL